MTMLISRIQWFYYDNGNTAPPCNISTFFDIVADYLLRIITDCQHNIKHLGNPNDLEGFDQILYGDAVDLHNRAVDLYNALIERSLA